MARTRTEVNRREIGRILKSPEVAALLTARAERVAAAARGIAPVGPPQRHYRDAIEVETDRTHDRARARVYARVPYALKVESEHRTLGRALDAAGG